MSIKFPIVSAIILFVGLTIPFTLASGKASAAPQISLPATVLAKAEAGSSIGSDTGFDSNIVEIGYYGESYSGGVYIGNRITSGYGVGSSRYYHNGKVRVLNGYVSRRGGVNDGWWNSGAYLGHRQPRYYSYSHSYNTGIFRPCVPQRQMRHVRRNCCPN